VLDALPLPTVLLDADGTVLLTNPAWAAAERAVEDQRIDGGVGADYFAMALRACDEGVGQKIVDSLRALSSGEPAAVAMDYSLAHPPSSPLCASRASRSPSTTSGAASPRSVSWSTSRPAG
jgi:hypothetical protein